MTAPKGSGSDEVVAIRSDIARTRGEMSRTVNEIEERLSPAHLKEQVASVTAGLTADLKSQVAELKGSVIDQYHDVKDHMKEDLGRELRGAKHKVSDELTHARAAVREATVGKVEHMVHDARETVTDAGTSILDSVKANPIPAALVAVGLGWLLMSGRSSRSSANRMHRYRLGEAGSYGGLYEEVQDRTDRGSKIARGAHDASEAVGHFAHDAGHRVEELASGARDAAMHFADDASRTGARAVRGAGRGLRRAEQGIESTFRANPLALGAVAVAVGAAIALALPSTHVEDEWLGDTKDRVIHRVEGAAGEAIHKAEDAVSQLTAGEPKGADTAMDGKSGNGATGAPKSHAV